MGDLPFSGQKRGKSGLREEWRDNGVGRGMAGEERGRNCGQDVKKIDLKML